MKFLIDAQLPRRLVYCLRGTGSSAIHTLDLPQGNRTPDDEINAISIREQWIVVSKDRDFVVIHLFQLFCFCTKFSRRVCTAHLFSIVINTKVGNAHPIWLLVELTRLCNPFTENKLSLTKYLLFLGKILEKMMKFFQFLAGFIQGFLLNINILSFTQFFKRRIQLLDEKM